MDQAMHARIRFMSTENVPLITSQGPTIRGNLDTHISPNLSGMVIEYLFLSLDDIKDLKVRKDNFTFHTNLSEEIVDKKKNYGEYVDVHFTHCDGNVIISFSRVNFSSMISDKCDHEHMYVECEGDVRRCECSELSFCTYCNIKNIRENAEEVNEIDYAGFTNLWYDMTSTGDTKYMSMIDTMHEFLDYSPVAIADWINSSSSVLP